MPIELTDADLEVLDYALAECDGGFADEAIRTVFLRAKEHGLAAGRARAIEEAAHICEVQGRLWAMHPAKSNNDVRKKEARRDEAYSLATALRALNAASPAS